MLSNIKNINHDLMRHGYKKKYGNVLIKTVFLQRTKRIPARYHLDCQIKELIDRKPKRSYRLHKHARTHT